MLWNGVILIVSVKNRNNIIANVFNNYFVNFELNIDKSIPRTRKSPLDFLPERNVNSFLSHLSHIEKNEIILN